ncbi:cache domain-containing protein [Arcobacter sp. YIC-310]|uniref:sensor histidine kinase n=1 Tax=Arcobacter sp. YIC-310 TaxID=3376632 RepID=UPI003C2510AB
MFKNEKDIVNLIKYLPALLIILFSFFITSFLYNEYQHRFELELKNLEKKYIELNKNEIEFEVKKVIDTINYEKKISFERLKKNLREQVNNAYKIALSIYKNNKDKSKDEIKRMIKDSLRDIRFNDNRGYLFIYEMSGKNVLHPIKPELEEKDLWNYQDKKGTFLLHEMNRILKKQNSTFYSWYWTKPDSLKEYEKIGYFKLFEPLDWFIGTGEYLYDAQEQLKNDIAESISKIRYKENGYIFALTYEGKFLSYYLDGFVGKNIKGLKINDDVVKTQNEMLKLAKNGGGFISYVHNQKPNSDNKVSKISYVNTIREWEWIIGTGFYMDDLYMQINEKRQLLKQSNQKSLSKLLVISIFITILLLVIFVYISALLEKKIKAYQLEIQKKIDEKLKLDNILSHQSLDIFKDFFKPKKDFEEFYIKKTFDKTFELVKYQLDNKYINVVSDICNTKIKSLENELIQVFINIISNSKDELIRLNTKRYIKIECQKKNEFLEISFLDNAGGIEDKNIQKVFEPHFTTKHDNDALGIGLFMCKEIIENHLNGKIFVQNSDFFIENIKYKGAKFIINLPLNDNKTNVDLS